LLAIRFGLRLWRVYLLDKPFVVETDHRSLETIFTQKIISRRVAGWYDELSEQVRERFEQGFASLVKEATDRYADVNFTAMLELHLGANATATQP
ncbi:RNase H-like domain found in reverse transcriptase, partial [Phytophthora infestans]